MEFQPNSSASEPIFHNKTVMRPCSKQGFFIGYLGRAKPLRARATKARPSHLGLSKITHC